MPMHGSITEALSVLAKAHPDYAAYLYSRVDAYERSDIPTAATSGRQMFFNIDWFGALPIRQRVGVIAHEVAHDMLNHAARGRHWRATGIVISRDGERTAPYDKNLMNIAMDAEINSVLRADKFELPVGVTIPHVDANPGVFTAEEVYFWLLDNTPPPPPSGGGEGEGEGEGEGGAPDNGPPAKGGKFGDGFDRHESPGADDPHAGTDVDEIDRQSAIQAGVAAGQRAGKGSGAFASLAAKLLAPKVDWKQELRDLIVTRIGIDNFDMRRFNRRTFVTRRTIEPARKSVKCPPIAFIIDTSGSIIKEATQFLSEVASVAQELCPERIDVIWTDYSVQHVDVLDDVDVSDVARLSIRGGGGTDLRRGFEWIDENHTEGTAAIIVLTDSETPWPDQAPECPVICATTNPGHAHPEWFSAIVDMKDGKK